MKSDISATVHDMISKVREEEECMLYDQRESAFKYDASSQKSSRGCGYMEIEDQKNKGTILAFVLCTNPQFQS